jgi:hypothetical protein
MAKAVLPCLLRRAQPRKILIQLITVSCRVHMKISNLQPTPNTKQSLLNPGRRPIGPEQPQPQGPKPPSPFTFPPILTTNPLRRASKGNPGNGTGSTGGTRTARHCTHRHNHLLSTRSRSPVALHHAGADPRRNASVIPFLAP